MALTNTATGWGLVARLFHWILAILIVMQVAVGLYMVEVIGEDLIQRFNLTQTHKAWGFVVFVLVALRILWRAVTRAPEPPEMPAWQRRASQASHLMLYALMLAIPITGWLMASASPYNDADAYVQIRNLVTLEYLFGADLLAALGVSDRVLLELPDPYPTGDEALTETLLNLHLGAALVLTAVLALHVAAALKHQFVDRDGLLRKMILGR